MESISANESLTSTDPANLPKPKKWPLILFIILTVIFFLGTTALGYFCWQKDKSFKNANQQNQEKQAQIDKLNQDKTNLEKQAADLTKENDDLKKANTQIEAEKANKKTIIEAYMEILTYFANVMIAHGGFTGWTEAEYQHGRDIAKKTQSSSFLATVDWAWNNITGDPAAKVGRFLKEIASGINENL